MSKKIFILVFVSTAFYIGCSVDGVKSKIQYCHSENFSCLRVPDEVSEEQCYAWRGGIFDECDSNNPPRLQYCYKMLDECKNEICQIIDKNLTVDQCSDFAFEVIDDCDNPPQPPPAQYCLLGGVCQSMDSMFCAFAGGEVVDSCPCPEN